MATLEQLSAALVKADAAGNAADAKAFADEIRKMRSGSESVPVRQSAVDMIPGSSVKAPPADPPEGWSWADVPLEAVKNIPSSAANFAGGIYQTVRHPIDTAGGLIDAAVGGVNKAMPKSIADWMASQANPEQAKNMARATKTADALGGFYKDRYGSMEGLKNTLATDPVGVVADISTIAAGGAGIAGQVPKAAKLADLLRKTSSVTNPVNVVAPLVSGAAKGVGIAGKNVLGLTTGVGAENVAQAFKAGREGKTAFFDNLTGKADMTDVLDTARQNVQNMGAQKSAAYRSGMVDITKDKSVLDFSNIDKALSGAANTVTFKGQVKNAKGAQLVSDIAEEVRKWKALDPAEFHTPEGLDALKQKIGGMVEGIPFEEKTARLAGGNIYTAVKNEIAAQAPTYAKVMKDYAEASDQIKEIERALSLGNKASADTAMRKLQSLSRNNVNTNYGNRLDLAKALEAGGGNEIMPAIAGQAMSSWVPRGLTGQAGSIATMGGAVASNPMLAALLLPQSPKAVGATLYGAGRAAGAAGKGLQAISSKMDGFKMTPQQTQAALLAAYQAGRLPLGNQ